MEYLIYENGEYTCGLYSVCKSLGYSITLKREDDNMRVIVHETL